MLSWCLILHNVRLIEATFRDKIGQPVNLVTLQERTSYLQMVSFSGPQSKLTTPLILSLEIEVRFRGLPEQRFDLLVLEEADFC